MASDEEKERKKRINDVKERLKLEQDIAKISERASKSVKDYAAVKNQIKDIDKEILELNKLIVELGDDASEEDKQRLKTLQELSKQLQQELSLTKAIGNELKTKVVTALSNQTQLLGKSLTMYNEVEKSVRTTSMSLGLSVSQMQQFRSVTHETNIAFQELGYEAGEIVATQQAFSDETGRVLMLTKQNLVSMARLGKLTGMGAQAMGEFAGQMEAYGFSAEKSVELTEFLMDTAQSMGVSSLKTIKKVQQNLNLLNKLDFQDGVKGLMKMAAYSEKYKLNMEAVASVSEKVFRPEGAIEAAANLQVLGGALSQMGDPFNLMYKARYAPEELAKSISKAAAQSATFNKQTGEFQLSAFELDRMKEAANALGLDMNELVKTSKQTAKLNMLGNVFGGMTEEQKNMLTGMTQLGKDGRAFITINGDKKYISDLNNNQLKALTDQQKRSEQNAALAQTTAERWTSFQNQLLASLDPVIKFFDDKVRPFIIGLGEFVSAWPKMTAGLTLGLIGIGKLSEWYLKGFWLGKGFNASAKKGGFFSGLKNIFKRNKSQSTVMENVMPSSNQGGGPSPNTGGQTGFLDKLKGIKPTQLLATGAAMVMLAGSVWILSDAMVKMKEASVGFEQVGMAIGLMAGMGLTLGILGTVLAPLGTVAIPVLLGIGGAMLMMGGAVWLASEGMSKLFESIGPNGDSIMKAGVGFMAMGAGVGVLSASLIGLGAGSLLALPALGIISSLTGLLTGTAEALDKVDFGGMVEGINNINTENIEALKELTSMLNQGQPIQIQFSDMNLKGDIMVSGEGGGKNNTDWINDPTFMNKLKNMVMEYIDKGQNGGKN